ncbi:MAG: hypothetical protein M3Q65_02980 [Chloroflexota bacterium]|nr:hypothetical protein [Chloroflexota bacterium]
MQREGCSEEPQGRRRFQSALADWAARGPSRAAEEGGPRSRAQQRDEARLRPRRAGQRAPEASAGTPKQGQAVTGLTRRTGGAARPVSPVAQARHRHPAEVRLRDRLRALTPVALLALLLAAAVLFCLPALLNARGVHSDAAIVGLQARHILRGEWSWTIWGTTYQGTVDALLVAAGFALAGDSALTLMAVPLAGHLLLVGLTFATLRRRLGPGPATVATLPVVFVPPVIHGVALYTPRQWAITAVVAAVWALDGASGSRRPLARYAAGAALGAFALYLDLFALQFLPGLAVFAFACCLDERPARAQIRRAGACALGFAAGLGAVWLLRQQVTAGDATTPGLALSAARIERNFALLWETCLPWLLGYKIFFTSSQPPAPFRVVQIAGAAVFAAGVFCGGAAVLLRRIPWPVRRLGLLGCLVAATSLTAFLPTDLPITHMMTRYLAPVVWMAPFALAPAVYLLGMRRFLPAIAPYVVAAAVGGWLGFGPYVDGPLPRRDPRGVASDAAALGAELRARGVTHAAAPYWLAYRLGFLWDEAPTVVPLHPLDDRYRPYRRAFEAAPVVAFIYHPSEPDAVPGPCEERLRQAGVKYDPVVVAEFTVFVWHRDPAALDSTTGCLAEAMGQ